MEDKRKGAVKTAIINWWYKTYQAQLSLSLPWAQTALETQPLSLQKN
jgi:hypothetical protein